MPSESKREEISDEESFALCVHYFIKALETLAADADEQCRRMAGGYVAWEVKDDVCRDAVNVLNLSGARGLAQVEKDGIAGMVAALNELPASLLAGSTAEDGKRAMNDPRWVPLRARAFELLKVLAPMAARSETFFKSQADNPNGPSD